MLFVFFFIRRPGKSAKHIFFLIYRNSFTTINESSPRGRIYPVGINKQNIVRRQLMKQYTKKDILRLVEEEDVEFIRLQFTDMFGNLQKM